MPDRGFCSDTREAITRLIFISSEPRAVDLALVLGSSSVDTISPAIKLHRDGLTRKILISGNGMSLGRKPEWQFLLEIALGQMLPSQSIWIEKEARNTKENILLSEKIISQKIGWARISSIAITTTPVHARRALMTARRYLPDTTDIIILPSKSQGCITAEGWWKTHIGRQFVWDELRRIGEYGAKGDIDGISPK